MNKPSFLFFSLGRCGTSLFQAIVNSHPKLYLSDEAHWFPHLESAGLQYHRFFEVNDVSVLKLPQSSFWREATLALNSALFEKVKDKSWGIQVIGTRNINQIENILSLYPDAKVITLQRDPRDLFLSLLTTGIGHYNSGEDLETIKGLINKNNRISLNLSYENICHEPEKALLELSNFLDVSYSKEMLNPLFKRISHAQDTALKANELGSYTNNNVIAKWKTKIPSFDLALQNYQYKAITSLGYKVYEGTGFIKIPKELENYDFILSGGVVKKTSIISTELEVKIQSVGCLMMLFKEKIDKATEIETVLEFNKELIQGFAKENCIIFDLRLGELNTSIRKIEHINNKGATLISQLFPIVKDKTYYLYSAGNETHHCLKDYYLDSLFPIKGIVDISPTKKFDPRFKLPIIAPHSLDPAKHIVLITSTFCYYAAKSMLEELGFIYGRNIFYTP